MVKLAKNNIEFIKFYPNASSVAHLQDGNKIVTAPIGNPPIPHISKYVSVGIKEN